MSMSEQSSQPGKHKNDPYGDIGTGKPDESAAPPPIPAATVVLLRDEPTDSVDPSGNQTELRVLMLKKTSKISFGGMWVFPGGKLDQADYPADGDIDQAAKNAAVRETMEEANLKLSPEDFISFSHWTPPPTTPKRFSTWFFVARGSTQSIQVDGGEIDDHRWINPAEALALHARGEIDLVPPTWVSLYHLSKFKTTDEACRELSNQQPRRYMTHLSKRADGVRVAMWTGDAGYEAWDADTNGATHRLTMQEGGFIFEHSAEAY